MATPIYPAEYLMDNVETQRGIADYAWLLQTVLGDPGPPGGAAARRPDPGCDRGPAVAGQPDPGMYGWAADQLDPNGRSGTRTGWRSCGRCWTASVSAGRRAQAWAAFQRRWPGWTRSTPAYGAVGAEHDPNAAGGYAAARMGDRDAVDEYLAARSATGRSRPAAAVDRGRRRVPRAGRAGHGRPRPQPLTTPDPPRAPGRCAVTDLVVASQMVQGL